MLVRIGCKGTYEQITYLSLSKDLSFFLIYIKYIIKVSRTCNILYTVVKLGVDIFSIFFLGKGVNKKIIFTYFV